MSTSACGEISISGSRERFRTPLGFQIARTFMITLVIMANHGDESLELVRVGLSGIIEKVLRVKMKRSNPAQSFPRSSNGRTAAFGAVNRGSNPCRGAKNLRINNLQA